MKKKITSIEFIYPIKDNFLSSKWDHPEVIGHTKKILDGFRWCGIYIKVFSEDEEDKLGEVWIGSYLRLKDGKIGNKICYFSSMNQVYMREITYQQLFFGFTDPMFRKESLLNRVFLFLKYLSERNLPDLQIDFDYDRFCNIFQEKKDPFFSEKSHAMDFFKRSSSELLICRKALEKRYNIEEAGETAVFIDFRKLNVVKFMDRNGSKIGSLDINFKENILHTELRFGGNMSYLSIQYKTKISLNGDEFSGYLKAAMEIIYQMKNSSVIQLYFQVGDMKMLEENLRRTIDFQKRKNGL